MDVYRLNHKRLIVILSYINAIFLFLALTACSENKNGNSQNENINGNQNENTVYNFVIVGGTGSVGMNQTGYISYSSDGLTWEEPIKNNYASWNDIAFGEEKFVAVGNYSEFINGGLISYSSNGEIWSIAGAPTDDNSINWHSVTYGNNKFVAVGDGGYKTYSTDGARWVKPFREINSLVNPNWKKIIYAQNKFIAVGNEGYITYSSDGKNWEKPFRPEVDPNPKNGLAHTIYSYSNWTAIAYGNNKFVASSGTNISYSSDGIEWSKLTELIDKNEPIFANTWEDIIFVNGKFIAVGGNAQEGYLGYSTDGIKWEGPIKEGKDSFQKISYGNNKFVAVTDNYKGLVQWSITGNQYSWKTSPTKLPNGRWTSIASRTP